VSICSRKVVSLRKLMPSGAYKHFLCKCIITYTYFSIGVYTKTGHIIQKIYKNYHKLYTLLYKHNTTVCIRAYNGCTNRDVYFLYIFQN
jgi:hypothetical protein